MTYENLNLHTEAGVQTITINRPSKLNALNSATIQELSTALKASNANPTVRVIVLTGSGKKLSLLVQIFQNLHIFLLLKERCFLRRDTTIYLL